MLWHLFLLTKLMKKLQGLRGMIQRNVGKYYVQIFMHQFLLYGTITLHFQLFPTSWTSIPSRVSEVILSK